MISVIQKEPQYEQRNEGLKLKMDQRKKKSREHASQSRGPSFCKNSVNEASEKQFFNKRCQKAHGEKSHGQTQWIIAKKRQVGFLLFITGNMDTRVIKKKANKERKKQVDQVTL